MTFNLPESYDYVAPIIWSPKLDVPAWIGPINPYRPVIYITMGSTGDPDFFNLAVNAFKNTPFQCILTTAGIPEVNDVPSNFSVDTCAPGYAVMEKADLVSWIIAHLFRMIYLFTVRTIVSLNNL